jgi:hypothetical protein
MAASAPRVGRLTPDSPKRCPFAKAELRRYVEAETGERPELHFGRTATLDAVRAWIWGYLDGEQELYYVSVVQSEGKSVLGMAPARGYALDQFAQALCESTARPDPRVVEANARASEAFAKKDWDGLQKVSAEMDKLQRRPPSR